MNASVNTINIVKIKLVREKTCKYNLSRLPSPEDVSAFAARFLQFADTENFIVFCMSSSLHLNCVQVVSKGTLDTALVHPREVFKPAILSNAHSIICFIITPPLLFPLPPQPIFQLQNRSSKQELS